MKLKPQNVLLVSCKHLDFYSSENPDLIKQEIRRLTIKLASRLTLFLKKFPSLAIELAISTESLGLGQPPKGHQGKELRKTASACI